MYLAWKFGSHILVDIFYRDLEDLGWENAFIKTYGLSSSEFYDEFAKFLKLPLEQQMAILPEGITSN